MLRTPDTLHPGNGGCLTCFNLSCLAKSAFVMRTSPMNSLFRSLVNGFKKFFNLRVRTNRTSLSLSVPLSTFTCTASVPSSARVVSWSRTSRTRSTADSEHWLNHSTYPNPRSPQCPDLPRTFSALTLHWNQEQDLWRSLSPLLPVH